VNSDRSRHASDSSSMTSSAVTSLAGAVTTDRHTSVAGSSALSSAVTDVTELGSAQLDKVRSYYSLTLDQ